MASYEDLASLAQFFKRAAIDAYMRTQPYPWTINGGKYEIDSSSVHTSVTRPNVDTGEGGGDWTSDTLFAFLVDGSNDEQFTTAFSTIRSRIDAALEPFIGLPDPDDIETEIEKCRQVTRGLSGAAAASNGGQVGAGVIPGNLALIMENSSAMSGASISAFKSRFLGQLGAAIGGHHGISIVVGSVLASEKGIWDAARQNVADILDDAGKASQALADSGTTPDWKTALKVSGWAVKGAGMFFPGAKPALEVVGLGITIIDGSIPASENAVINGDDAEAVLTSFEKALTKLNEQITAEEELLEANLVQNLANIRNDTTSYDLTAPPVENENEGDVIAYTPGLIDEITQTYMPTIAGELTSLADTSMSTTLTPIARSAELGIGYKGPHSSWYELRYLLWELLKDMSWEVTMGAKNLDLVLQELEGLNTSTAQDLQDVIAQLEEGSRYDPWN